MLFADRIDRVAILAGGVLATVAMWAFGYLSHLPGVMLPGPATLAGLTLVLLIAGRFVGAHASPGVAAAAGGVAGLINLLVLGSLLGGDDGRVGAEAAIWVPASIVVHALVARLGTVGVRRVRWSAADWHGVMAAATTSAIVLVVVAGGLVTSTETGLAVPDWPNSYGVNMFLYPLSRMTGGIYFEHAHRLYGSLVGLTALLHMVLVWRGDARPAVRRFAVVIFLLVCCQGIMGGLRVTGRFTLEEVPLIDEAANLRWAVAHGVLAQIILGATATLWLLRSPSWQRSGSGRAGSAILPVFLVAAGVMQLILGAAYRHYQSLGETGFTSLAVAHTSWAFVVAGLAIAVGTMTQSRFGVPPLLRKLGFGLVLVTGIQFLLGVAALFAVMGGAESSEQPVAILLATAHQANGAIFLSLSITIAAASVLAARAARRIETYGQSDSSDGALGSGTISEGDAVTPEAMTSSSASTA